MQQKFHKRAILSKRIFCPAETNETAPITAKECQGALQLLPHHEPSEWKSNRRKRIKHVQSSKGGDEVREPAAGRLIVADGKHDAKTDTLARLVRRIAATQAHATEDLQIALLATPHYAPLCLTTRKQVETPFP